MAQHALSSVAQGHLWGRGWGPDWLGQPPRQNQGPPGAGLCGAEQPCPGGGGGGSGSAPLSCGPWAAATSQSLPVPLLRSGFCQHRAGTSAMCPAWRRPRAGPLSTGCSWLWSISSVTTWLAPGSEGFDAGEHPCTSAVDVKVCGARGPGAGGLGEAAAFWVGTRFSSLAGQPWAQRSNTQHFDSALRGGSDSNSAGSRRGWEAWVRSCVPRSCPHKGHVALGGTGVAGVVLGTCHGPQPWTTPGHRGSFPGI